MTQRMTRDEALALKLWQRESALVERGLKGVEPQYCIVWDDLDDLDAAPHVTTPSPMWLAMAMHGNVLPPVSVYPLDVNDRGRVIEGHGLHDSVVPAMTEEQAMEYLLQKDVPRRVWDAPGGSNARRFVICHRTMVPVDKTFRDAWRLTQENEELENAA